MEALTQEEILALMRLVRFIIRSTPLHDPIWNQNVTVRDALMNDECIIDLAIDRMEHDDESNK